MKRLVETDRWRDSFFIELHPNAKLLLSYLYDNCNEAGFIEIHYTLMSTQLKMDKEFIITSLKALQSVLLSDKKKKIFIKDFLRHQNKLPLIKGNEEQDLIISKLESNLERFGNPKEITDILKNVRDIKDIEKENKKRDKETKRFVVPAFEDFKKYYLSEKPSAHESEIKDLYDHYVKVGWVTKGGTKIKDYEAAIRGGISRKEKIMEQYNGNSGNKKSRSENAMDVYSELTTKKKEN